MTNKQRLLIPGMGVFESLNGINWRKVKKKQTEQKTLGRIAVNLEELRRAQKVLREHKERKRRSRPKYRHLRGIDSFVLIQTDRYMPTKRDILEEAIRIFMQEHARTGMPFITPEEEELKEGGYFERARLRLMSSKPDELYGGASQKEIKEEQKRYLEAMARGLGLKVVPEKEYRRYEKKVTEEWRGKQKVKKAEFEREKLRKSWLGALGREKKLKRQKGSLRWKLRGLREQTRMGPKPMMTTQPGIMRIRFKKEVPAIVGYNMKVYGPFRKGDVAKLPTPNAQALIKHGVAAKTRRKTATRRKQRPSPILPYTTVTRKKAREKKPEPTVAEIVEKHRKGWKKIVERHKEKPRVQIQVPKRKKKKRKKLHTERAGKNMKVLKRRIKDGQKVFAFPDSVWKVRNK